MCLRCVCTVLYPHLFSCPTALSLVHWWLLTVVLSLCRLLAPIHLSAHLDIKLEPGLCYIQKNTVTATSQFDQWILERPRTSLWSWSVYLPLWKAQHTSILAGFSFPPGWWRAQWFTAVVIHVVFAPIQPRPHHPPPLSRKAKSQGKVSPTAISFTALFSSPFPPGPT